MLISNCRLNGKSAICDLQSVFRHSVPVKVPSSSPAPPADPIPGDRIARLALGGPANMYVAHFGLRHRPFRPTPDPAAYYPATTHESALQRLQQALADEDRLASLSGEPGTGKTLLAAILVERLDDQAAWVYLTNGHLAGPADLFQSMLYDLGEPYEHKSEQELRLSVTDGVLKRFAEGRRTLLLLDEAHHLRPCVLEELRQLGNLETRDGKAVQS